MLGDGPVAQQIRIISRDRALLIVVREGDETTQGQQPQGVGHPTPLPLDQGRAKANGKTADADALERGSEEMAGLMHHDQQGEHQKGGQHVHMSVRSPVGSFWLESLAADVGHQRFGQQDAAVGLLAVLQQGRHGSADG